jgi:hypothetical protein
VTCAPFGILDPFLIEHSELYISQTAIQIAGAGFCGMDVVMPDGQLEMIMEASKARIVIASVSVFVFD